VQLLMPMLISPGESDLRAPRLPATGKRAVK